MSEPKGRRNGQLIALYKRIQSGGIVEEVAIHAGTHDGKPSIVLVVEDSGFLIRPKARYISGVSKVLKFLKESCPYIKQITRQDTDGSNSVNIKSRIILSMPTKGPTGEAMRDQIIEQLPDILDRSGFIPNSPPEEARVFIEEVFSSPGLGGPLPGK